MFREIWSDTFTEEDGPLSTEISAEEANVEENSFFGGFLNLLRPWWQGCIKSQLQWNAKHSLLCGYFFFSEKMSAHERKNTKRKKKAKKNHSSVLWRPVVKTWAQPTNARWKWAKMGNWKFALRSTNAATAGLEKLAKEDVRKVSPCFCFCFTKESSTIVPCNCMLGSRAPNWVEVRRQICSDRNTI